MQFHEIFVKEENKLNYYVFYFFNSVKNKNFVKSASTGSNITPINYLPFFHRDPLKRRLKEHYKMEKLIKAGLMEPKANPNVYWYHTRSFSRKKVTKIL